jgi:hypothetical protein
MSNVVSHREPVSLSKQYPTSKIEKSPPGEKMPKLQLRKLEEVPSPSKTSRAVLEQQLLYDGFIKQLNGHVGQLELEPGEAVRIIKVRLRRASSRLGIPLEVWDFDGRVYFRSEGQRRRRGPRKTTSA